MSTDLIISGAGLNTGTVFAAEDLPRRKRNPRLGSGVPCPNVIGDSEGTYTCESPNTTEMRSGRDSEGRPLAEMLCEDCGAVFVAVRYSMPTHVRFADVARPAGNLMADAPWTPVALPTALRRGERYIRKTKPDTSW